MKEHSNKSEKMVLPPIERNQIPEDLRELLGRFEAENIQTSLTGQVARDLILGEDIGPLRRAEFITSLSLDETHALVSKWNDYKIFTPSHTDRDLRVERCEIDETNSKPNRLIRISPLRHHFRPHRWFQKAGLSGLELDLATREITTHAFAIGIDGTIVDPFGGVADLRRKRIQTVIPHQVVFREGGLWHLKIAKYIGYYGFKPAPHLLKSAQRNAGNVLDSKPRLWKEYLDKILLSNHVEEALEFLHNSQVLPFILPEVESMIGFHKSCPVHHKDLWEHTKQVIHQADRNLTIRWAALAHDIGKIQTRSVSAEGKVHFFRHEEFGALLFKGIAHRLGFSEQDEKRTHYVIRNHSRVNLYDPSWSDAAIRRLIRDCEGHLDDLITFSKADFTTKRVAKIAQLKSQLSELETRIEDIREKDAKEPALPKGLGHLIISRFKLRAGPQIGEIREWLEKEVEADRLEGGQPAEVYLDYLYAHREVLSLPPIDLSSG